jgi:hypothetical protein
MQSDERYRQIVDRIGTTDVLGMVVDDVSFYVMELDEVTAPSESEGGRGNWGKIDG